MKTVSTESVDAPRRQGARLRRTGKVRRKERNAAGADAAALECSHIYEMGH
jgi:hypothetical protein